MSLTQLHRRAGKLLAAVTLGLIAAAIVPTAKADDNDSLMNAVRTGSALADRGDLAGAIRQYEYALPLAERLRGPGDKLTSALITDLARKHAKLGNLDTAEKYYLRNIAAWEKQYGADRYEVVLPINSLADFYNETQQYAKAEPYFARSLKLTEAKYGPDALETGDILNSQALLLEHLGQYAQAEAGFLRRLKIVEAKRGPNDETVAGTLYNLGQIYVDLARYDDAERTYLRSLEIYTMRHGPQDAQLIGVLSRLGVLYYFEHQYQKAEVPLQRALKIATAKLGTGDPSTAYLQDNLGLVYFDLGQYSKAVPLMEQSFQTLEKKLEPDDLELGRSLTNLGNLYKEMGNYSKAQPLLERTLAIKQKVRGPKHADVALAMDNLSQLFKSMGQTEQAEKLNRDAREIAEAALGPEHPAIIPYLGNQANIYESAERYEAAEKAYHRCLDIAERSLGHQDRLVATVVSNLGNIDCAMGRNDEAAAKYHEAIEIYAKTLGSEHPHTISTHNNLALLYADTKQWDKSGREFDLSRRSVRQYVADVLPLLSEIEQLTFLENNDRGHLNNCLSLGYLRKDDAALAAKSASWLANAKAVAQESLARTSALTRESKDPTVAQTASSLVSVRTQLANMLGEMQNSGDSGQRADVRAKLVQREQELVKQLNLKIEATASGQWVELDDLRQAIGKQAVLIDIIRYRQIDFVARKGHRENDEHPNLRYAAWLTPAVGAGAVRVVDLGEAEKIDAAVAAFQTAFKPCLSADPAKNPLAKGEREAEQLLQVSLAELSKLILAPLLPQIEDKQELIVSPDAGLWLVPWSALLVDDKYAIEKWNVRYVVSARDLLRHRAPDVSGSNSGGARIFANPNYDLDARGALASLDRVFRKIGIPGTPVKAPPGLLQLGPEMLASRWAGDIGRAQMLPGTQAEADAIAPNLKKYATGDLRTYTGDEALEDIFKKLRSPRVLVMSTHGFFLADQEVKLTGADQSASADRSQRTGLAQDAAGNVAENPLLRCGLMLADCNQRGARPRDSQLDDGILTGKEIVDANLHGTELVVLSACETGLGQVNNGEGVAGLRQAFQLAGAQSVVATLWQIRDDATVPLMNDFFANLADGQSKSDALRNAQLARIKSRRERRAAAHPLFWAAFTLTGAD